MHTAGLKEDSWSSTRVELGGGGSRERGGRKIRKDAFHFIISRLT